jgi:branched-chain amino acid transport system substrate-binding protein
MMEDVLFSFRQVQCSMKFWRLLFPLMALSVLVSCQKPAPPVKVGFIGCLTGRSADLGIAGRDGFLLAVREMNEAGGINGRKIVPVVKDNALDPEKAKQALQEILNEKVSFIVGPMTSQMAMTLTPAVNASAVPMISPTVSTNELIGIDDYFFRVYYANSQAAVAMANHVKQSGLKKIAVLYDTRNSAYTDDWVNTFSDSFITSSHSVERLPFNAATVGSFYEMVAGIKEMNPNGMLILANSIDTALICQQAYKLGMKIPKFATGWSYSGKLITYGGRSVEGLVVVQSVDMKTERRETARFLDAFWNAHYVDPTFPAVHAYDATRLGFMALSQTGDKENLKERLLSIKSFSGVQKDFSFDRFGDVVDPPIYFMKIDQSTFLPM